MSYPAYGTATIKCSKRSCDWSGLETDLSKSPHPTLKNTVINVCPKCGNDSYKFENIRSKHGKSKS